MYYPYMSAFNQAMVTPSYVRVFHASPDAPAVDVYANGKLIAKGLSYKDFTEYLPLIPGKYSILVFPSGTTTNPVINTSIDVMPNSSYTVAAAGMLKNIKPLIIPDTASPIYPGSSQLKFVHLSPDAPMVDLTFPDGTILFRNIEFKEISPNLMIHPGNHTFELRLAGTDKVVLTAPNQLIKPDQYYTIYAVGLAKDQPPLQIITALDKNSY